MITKLQHCWDLVFTLVGDEGFLAKKKTNMHSADREWEKAKRNEHDRRTSWAGAKQLWWAWACLGSQQHALQNIAPILFMLLHYLPYAGFLLLWFMESCPCMALPLNFSVPWTAGWRREQIEIAIPDQPLFFSPLHSGWSKNNCVFNFCLLLLSEPGMRVGVSFVCLRYLNVCPQILSIPVSASYSSSTYH